MRDELGCSPPIVDAAGDKGLTSQSHVPRKPCNDMAYTLCGLAVSGFRVAIRNRLLVITRHMRVPLPLPIGQQKKG